MTVGWGCGLRALPESVTSAWTGPTSPRETVAYPSTIVAPSAAECAERVRAFAAAHPGWRVGTDDRCLAGHAYRPIKRLDEPITRAELDEVRAILKQDGALFGLTYGGLLRERIDRLDAIGAPPTVSVRWVQDAWFGAADIVARTREVVYEGGDPESSLRQPRTARLEIVGHALPFLPVEKRRERGTDELLAPFLGRPLVSLLGSERALDLSMVRAVRGRFLLERDGDGDGRFERLELRQVVYFVIDGGRSELETVHEVHKTQPWAEVWPRVGVLVDAVTGEDLTLQALPRGCGDQGLGFVSSGPPRAHWPVPTCAGPP